MDIIPTSSPPAVTDELRGLTWDHPRGYAPLEELARLDAAVPPGCETVGLPLRWDRQPPAAFETAPIDGLASDYDLLVVEHIGLGAAVEAGCLVAMDDLFPAAQLEHWRRRTVGACYDSHVLDGRVWALPLDAAAQVAAARPDLMAGHPMPRTWDEVLALPVPPALCMGGPHALLTFCALCVALGEEPGRGPEFVSRETGGAALETMARLLARGDPRLWRLGPAGLLAAMASAEGPAYCPLVYGYAPATQSGPYPLTFADAPASHPGGRPGSVLGGAGLAVSHRRTDDPLVREAIRDHLRRLLAEPVQCELFPVTGGQPSDRAAWLDPRTNSRWGGFYRATLATVEHAWVRPRAAGFPDFQRSASRLLREGLADGRPPARLLAELDEGFRHRARRPDHLLRREGNGT
ncbi:carbohydrate ABC transporter substrate-binding protein [Streptomyces sp. NPDC021225]|uniref:carbohydrate ABC transporter substrate-binding protein n=1 Tax=Streptomyces sp. NPDC021225 TaxID=3365121 RepID=UPI0037B9E450